MRDWFDRNFTPKGLFGVLLFLITAIPDWVSREDFWRGRMYRILHLVLSPWGRLSLIGVGVLIIWLDHRTVLKNKGIRQSAFIDSLAVELTPSRDRPAKGKAMSGDAQKLAEALRDQFRANVATTAFAREYVHSSFRWRDVMALCDLILGDKMCIACLRTTRHEKFCPRRQKGAKK